MSFDIDRCIIKQVWCGGSATIPSDKKKYYKGVGTRYECLQKGFGAGSSVEKKKNLPTNSLRRIPYVGDKMESNFKANGITNLKDLKTKMLPLAASGKEAKLKIILVNSNGKLNKKAYNSTIKYLYENGILNLPRCKKYA